MATPTPLPKIQIGILLLMQVSEPIAATVIFPFIAQFVNEVGVTHGDTQLTGYYVGLIESLFFATEALFILQWGRLSDRVGRRPVLLFGLFGLAASNMCFGLSTTFTGLVASRALSGLLNGNAGVMKSMMAELTDETNQAQAYSWIPLCWLSGAILGPFIGGSLQHPAERFPQLFGGVVFWEKYPYFLPCSIAAMVSISAIAFGAPLLRETLPSLVAEKKAARPNESTALLADDAQPPLPSPSQERKESPPIRALLTPRVQIVLLNYSFLGILNLSLYSLFTLFLAVPLNSGGLGLKPALIGRILSTFGLASGIFQVACFPSIHRRFGGKAIVTTAMTAFFLLFSTFPLMHQMALRSPSYTSHESHESLPVELWCMLGLYAVLVAVTDMCHSTIFMLMNAAVSTPEVLGATNGLAQTIVSVFRAIGPAGATALFAVSVKHNIAAGYFVFFILMGLSVVAIVSTTFLPKDEHRFRVEAADLASHE